MIEDKGN